MAGECATYSGNSEPEDIGQDMRAIERNRSAGDNLDTRVRSRSCWWKI